MDKDQPAHPEPNASIADDIYQTSAGADAPPRDWHGDDCEARRPRRRVVLQVGTYLALADVGKVRGERRCGAAGRRGRDMRPWGSGRDSGRASGLHSVLVLGEGALVLVDLVRRRVAKVEVVVRGMSGERRHGTRAPYQWDTGRMPHALPTIAPARVGPALSCSAHHTATKVFEITIMLPQWPSTVDQGGRWVRLTLP